MLRRMATGGATAAMLLVLLAGCGGSSATPSPSVEASVEAAATPAGTEGVASQAPSSAPGASATATSQKKTAACAGVGVRKAPGSSGAVLVRLGKGAVVRAVDTVTGDHYDATTCGTAGADWLKIDRVNGKSVKSLYGVSYAYAAVGFFR